NHGNHSHGKIVTGNQDETILQFFIKTFQLIGTAATRLLKAKRAQGRPAKCVKVGKRVPYVQIIQTIVKM
ncbi:hypothetical protein ABE132_25810, partial [Peribacillus simplex]|uniref:hypothetical protein n=1 Tax=Peribacillus simplex TaxID=1478 RepID=UPI003D2814DC